MLEPTNKLELGIHSRSRTHSDVEGLLHSDLFTHCTDQTRPTHRPAGQQACLSTGPERREKFHPPSEQGRGRGRGRRRGTFPGETRGLCCVEPEVGYVAARLGTTLQRRGRGPMGRAASSTPISCSSSQAHNYNVPGHILKYIKYTLWQC